MPIKHAILRTDDGQAYDLLRPGCKNKAGIGGTVEVLAAGSGKVRVSINGVEIKGFPARFLDDLSNTPVTVAIDQFDADGKVVDTKGAEIEITGLPAPEPKLDAA